MDHAAQVARVNGGRQLAQHRHGLLLGDVRRGVYVVQEVTPTAQLHDHVDVLRGGGGEERRAE